LVGGRREKAKREDKRKEVEKEMRKKVWLLTVTIKKNDQLQGKLLYRVLLDFLKDAGISGATVINGVDGFGKRGRSALHIEGLSMNYPVMIQVVDEEAKLEPLLSEIKRMVDDNGLVTITETFTV
jgi:PII-like signaling protein